MLDEMECIYIERGTAKGKAIAVLTSGGDAPGMNATLRAIVRLGLYIGCKVYFIKEGFSGMVEGGENIIEANWLSVSSIIHTGGTIIGSARCKEFREYKGRLKAALHLLQNNISNLIVIGGDGSLTGAHIFHLEWPSLLKDLYESGDITSEQREQHQVLKVVGIVASIDNDFCGTDMTIGTDSALHRIIDAVDSIVSTAFSHKRVFILEIMGRRCGYLSIVSGIMSEADFVFIPESPPEEDWPDVLCSKLQQARDFGRRMNIIMVSEGATDCQGNVITAAQIKSIIEERLHYDARITVLGHIQRGGNPSAFDRILGCRMGSAAVLALMNCTDNMEPTVVVVKGNQIVNLPLMECVEKTLAVSEAMSNRDWTLARSLRGTSFEQNWEVYKMLTGLRPPKEITSNGRCLAIVHVGAPACGLNAAVHSFVRNSICTGYRVYGISNGIEGLVEGKFEQLGWSHVSGWVSEGGAKLGTKRRKPDENTYDLIAKRLNEFKIEGLLIIGGFEAFLTCHLLSGQRGNYIEFCIPMVVIPATISNNVPGTDYSLGADTALNEITDICDRIRQSAQGTKHRVFVIETMGGYCGYLATVAGMAGAADTSYIFEEKFSIKDLQEDVYHMMHKMGQGVERGLILLNEKASENYNLDFIYRLYAEEGKKVFTCRKNIIGHIQQGGAPSPFDRNFGTKLASKCIHWFSSQFESSSQQTTGRILCKNKESACLIGLIKRDYIFTPVSDLMQETLLEYRTPKLQWWLKLRPIARILGRIESTYDHRGTYIVAEKEQKQKQKQIQ